MVVLSDFLADTIYWISQISAAMYLYITNVMLLLAGVYGSYWR